MARVSHFEIHVDDIDRAKDFYSAVFGWEFTPWGSEPPYWLITTGPDSEPGINGGMIRRQGTNFGDALTAFVCTVQVDSMDDAVAKATARGGSVVVPKMAIPGLGWLVYITDTEQNIIGMHQADPSAA